MIEFADEPQDLHSAMTMVGELQLGDPSCCRLRCGPGSDIDDEPYLVPAKRLLIELIECWAEATASDLSPYNVYVPAGDGYVRLDDDRNYDAILQDHGRAIARWLGLFGANGGCHD